MRRTVRLLATALTTGVAAASVLVPAGPSTGASSSAAVDAVRAPVQDYLAGQLADLDTLEQVTVLVHGETLAAARAAVAATGMTAGTSFDRIGVVVARGTKAQVAAARLQPGVT